MTERTITPEQVDDLLTPSAGAMRAVEKVLRSISEKF
jgi:hypothetical protein